MRCHVAEAFKTVREIVEIFFVEELIEGVHHRIGRGEKSRQIFLHRQYKVKYLVYDAAIYRRAQRVAVAVVAVYSFGTDDVYAFGSHNVDVDYFGCGANWELEVVADFHLDDDFEFVVFLNETDVFHRANPVSR